ncbi:hypothetical protein BCR44DRAFT_1495191 [Catenaria anguillulae PL171]|uniref:Large ribosomal subunit protein mL45 n=1 Tax=Catenaria anguillulae PL171 TaxID=765915 RepID=A0A1Y2I549_9FUNG|nr:hypothetical protein BCR44DRAFT_1495191 [Catenaria anguillulae PL171]
MSMPMYTRAAAAAAAAAALRRAGPPTVTVGASIAASRLFAPALAHWSQSRTYAGETKALQYKITEVGKVLDPYLRPSWPPLPVSKQAAHGVYQYFKNLAMSTYYAAQLKKDLLALGTKFDATQFPVQVEQMYKAMNTAFATGKPNDLEPYVTPLMFSTLKSQMRKRPAKLDWEYIGAFERPKIVNLVYGKGELDTFGVAQITVKIHSHQRLTVTDKSGNVVKVTESKPIEYLVVERFTTPDGTWRISSKVEPPQEK